MTNIAISEERNQPDYKEFIENFESNSDFSWSDDVETPTLSAIRELLKAATSEEYPNGIQQLSNSRYFQIILKSFIYFKGLSMVSM